MDKGKQQYKFLAKDFYEMLEQQGYRCALTRRELTPETTTAEHKILLSEGGKHEIENIYLISKDAAKLKRSMSENQMAELAFEILKTIGKKYGFKASRLHKV